MFAARALKSVFILNVIPEHTEKEVIGAVAGDIGKAHEAGVSFCRHGCAEFRQKRPIL